jgi:hypothetical protein
MSRTAVSVSTTVTITKSIDDIVTNPFYYKILCFTKIIIISLYIICDDVGGSFLKKII